MPEHISKTKPTTQEKDHETEITEAKQKLEQKKKEKIKID